MLAQYMDLGWIGPIHRPFLILSPCFERTWSCLRNAVNLLLFSCPSKPCASWLFIQNTVCFLCLCCRFCWDLCHLCLVKASQKIFVCLCSLVSSFICFVQVQSKQSSWMSRGRSQCWKLLYCAGPRCWAEDKLCKIKQECLSACMSVCNVWAICPCCWY